MSLYQMESDSYKNSPFFVRLNENNYKRLIQFFGDVDLPFMVNEYIDNALVDLVNNLCYIKKDAAMFIMEEEK